LKKLRITKRGETKMAVYRHIHIDFWQDGFVLDLTPEEKYFYLYLMTNSKTSQCGIYELPKRIIETETGYNRETVEKLLMRFEEYKKIFYDKETNEIFIKNWIKYNKGTSPKVKKCIEKELKEIKNKHFVKIFIIECNRYGYSINTLSIDYKNSMDTGAEDENKLENHYGEKEKEKQKEKEEEKEKQKYKIKEFAKLYEKNIGLVNGVVSEWLIEISKYVDIRLFKRAIEIATNNGSCNKGYINGILKQWEIKNIKSYEDLKAYEVSVKNRGTNSYGEYSNDNIRDSRCEEDYLYQKPTKEQLEEARRLLEEN